ARGGGTRERNGAADRARVAAEVDRTRRGARTGWVHRHPRRVRDLLTDHRGGDAGGNVRRRRSLSDRDGAHSRGAREIGVARVVGGEVVGGHRGVADGAAGGATGEGDGTTAEGAVVAA